MQFAEFRQAFAAALSLCPKSDALSNQMRAEIETISIQIVAIMRG
jgi:hypothetical protein